MGKESRNPELDKLLAGALQVTAGPEREGWIERACRGDPDLARRLRDLVAAHESAGSFLSKPLVATRPSEPASEPGEKQPPAHGQ